MSTNTTCTPSRPVRVRRLTAVLATGALGATGSLGLAGVAAATHTHRAAKPATVTLARRGKLGDLLVGVRGMTLYHFTKDRPGSPACSGGCLAIWPPLLVRGSAAPRPGPGITHLGVIDRHGVGRQVTYYGEPLYYYSGDTKPGETTGQGFEHLWFVVHPRSTKDAHGHARAHKH